MVDGRFELIDSLGSGGMGTVWRAYDSALHRQVALKEVLAEASGAAADVQRERVLREARALARIGHPNVVAIHHIVDSPAEPHPWLVMELVRGGSLADRLAAGPMAPAWVAQIGRGLLAGLRAAHAVGVQHRDIKPANVLLREDDSPVLTDFGIAAIAGQESLTSTGIVLGSLEYVAPERLTGVEGHPASDLWSLGLLLFAAVEGYQPMRRETSIASIAAVMKGEVPEIRQAGPLTPVLRALLTPDPDRRPLLGQVDSMLAQVISGSWAAVPVDSVSSGSPRTPYGANAAYSGSSPATMPPPTTISSPASVSPRTMGPPHVAMPLHTTVSSPASVPPPASVSPHASVSRQTSMPQQLSMPQQVSLPPHATMAPDTSMPPHGTMPPHGAMPPHATVPPPHAIATPRRRGIWIGAGSAIVVVAAAVAAVLVWQQAGGSDASGPDSAVTSPATADPATPGNIPGMTTAPGGQQTTDLLTPTGVRQAIAALEQATGGQQFTETTIYPTYVNTGAPVHNQPTEYDNFIYRDGKASREGAGGEMDGEDTANLDIISWGTLPALLQTAQAKLGVPKPTMRYVIVDPSWAFNDDKPTLLVHLNDEYGGAYLAADIDGTVVKLMPRK